MRNCITLFLSNHMLLACNVGSRHVQMMSESVVAAMGRVVYN